MLVENLECTRAMRLSRRSSVRSAKKARSCKGRASPCRRRSGSTARGSRPPPPECSTRFRSTKQRRSRSMPCAPGRPSRPGRRSRRRPGRSGERSARAPSPAAERSTGTSRQPSTLEALLAGDARRRAPRPARPAASSSGGRPCPCRSARARARSKPATSRKSLCGHLHERAGAVAGPGSAPKAPRWARFSSAVSPRSTTRWLAGRAEVGHEGDPAGVVLERGVVATRHALPCWSSASSWLKGDR